MVSRDSAKKIMISALISSSLLGVFALVGTALVLEVHQLTKAQIQKNIKASLLQSLNNIIPSNTYNNDLLKDTLLIPANKQLGKRKEMTTVYQAWMNNTPIAVAFDIVAPDGYSGKIALLIAIKYNGQLSGVRVINHRETPGLGDKIDIKRSNWITSFNGKSLENTTEQQWRVKKDGGHFDQFTGATISPRAIIKAVHHALLYFKINKNKLFKTLQKTNEKTSK